MKNGHFKNVQNRFARFQKSKIYPTFFYIKELKCPYISMKKPAKKPAKKHMRALFTDKWNSFWHFWFGVLSRWVRIIIPNFIIYELIDFRDVNLWIDLSEFFMGLVLIWVLVTTYESIYNKIEI